VEGLELKNCKNKHMDNRFFRRYMVVLVMTIPSAGAM
jgi:hypothetical protein